MGVKMKRLKDAKNLPTTVKAGYQYFTINVYGKFGGLNPRNVGAVTHKEHLISLDGTQNLGDGVETLLHELFHIAWTQGYLSEVVNHDAEEKVVGILSHQVATMIHDNPDLFKWIIKSVS